MTLDTTLAERQPFDLSVPAMNGLRRGRTTGSCATAAVKAALKLLLHGERETQVDIGLPDLDGSEVAKDLRRVPGCKDALIIAVTGLGDEHRGRMLAAGCDAFYTKPVEPDLLEGLLKR